MDNPTTTNAISLILPFEGRTPTLASGAWVAPGGVVIGDVTLGANASVWYGAVLRGDVNAIRIGRDSNVQDGAVIHVTRDLFNTEVGDVVTIGHHAVVHGCRVCDGALIGIGAIVLDGAVIGEGALVGAGAVVTPGMKVPPGTLVVGTPARVVRTLDDDEVQSQREHALKYVKLAHSHAQSQG